MAQVTTQIQVRDVSFSFPSMIGHNSKPVLQQISFDVKKGEFLCLLGESGCGKTTLLQIIAGLLTPQIGQVVVDSRASNNGFVVPCTIVFQDLNLFYWETALGNIRLALRARGLEKSEQIKVAVQLLEKVNLSGFENYYPNELSGGMCQRLAIARALATNAPILLLDEPFSDLDERTQRVLEGDLLRLALETELTIVMVTHDLRQAIRLGNRVIVLAGRPAQIQAAENIDLPRPRNEETELFKIREKFLGKYLEI